jgi:hypothetical protein
MAESFTLSVPYKQGEKQVEAELRVFGYTHKIAVMVDGAEILFEPDEERNYRAVLPDPQTQKSNLDMELIRGIAAELEKAFQ